MRCVDLGLLILLFVLIPWLAYRFGEDSRDGIETDQYQRHRSRGG